MSASIGGIEIRSGRDPLDVGLVVTDKGIDSWFDLPAVKTSVEERTGADGAFPVAARDVVYSARTVTFNLAYLGDDRAFAVDTYNRFNALAHQIVPVRVTDVDDTFVTGWVETAYGPRWQTDGEFVVTVHAADPRRYAWDAQAVTLTGAAATGGIRYPIRYDIRYNGAPGGASPSGSVSNEGTTTSWPVITVHGDLVGGFTLLDSRGRAITYDDDVLMSSPVTIDCGRRTAMVLGQNRSRALSRREWFDVPPRGDLTVTYTPAQVAGSSWADLELRSAWI